MTKRELDRALRFAAKIARENEFFLIGSQAVYAYSRRPPAEVRLSRECDLYPKNRPQAANLIDSELGRRSKFARAHGFYVDVVTPELATLPRGWQRRLKPLRVGRITAFCLEIHDLVISKRAAGRLKDLEFVGAMLHLRLANPHTIRQRIRQCPSRHEHARLRARLQTVLDDLSR